MSEINATLTANWNYPTAILVGPGRISEIAMLCSEHGITRPLIVADRGTAALPFTGQILSICEKAGLKVALFNDVQPNPTGENVAAGVDALKMGSHDGVIALGGGSGIDAGKAVALMAGQQHSIWDFEDAGDNWQRVDVNAMVPCIAVPTTAGTGSEVGRASVIIKSDSHEKKIIFHPRMLPVAVLSDPELTIGLPPSLTAATGIDAFTHCFEAFCAPGYHPMADGIALEGMRLIKDWLPEAYRTGSNIEARTHMLVAASMGATAFQKGLGVIHALSHPVGAVYDAHHGLCNAIFLPYAMCRNRLVIADKMTQLGVALGIKLACFDSVLDWVLAFRAELGIPHEATILGIKEGDIDRLAEMSLHDAALSGNPVKLEKSDLVKLLGDALAGKLPNRA